MAEVVRVFLEGALHLRGKRLGADFDLAVGQQDRHEPAGPVEKRKRGRASGAEPPGDPRNIDRHRLREDPPAWVGEPDSLHDSLAVDKQRFALGTLGDAHPLGVSNVVERVDTPRKLIELQLVRRALAPSGRGDAERSGECPRLDQLDQSRGGGAVVPFHR